MSTATDVAALTAAGLDAARLLLSLSGTEEEAHKLLSIAAVERARLAADAAELAKFDSEGRPR